MPLIILGGFGEGIVESGRACDGNTEFRMTAAEFADQVTGRRHGDGNLVGFLAGQGQGDVNSRGFFIAGHQAVNQERFA